MKISKIRKKIIVFVMGVTMMCIACASHTKPQTQEQNNGEGSNKEGVVTLKQAADYFFVAADDYNKHVKKEDLLEGIGDKITKANRLQVLVMVSRAFGELPEPIGNNERLSWKEADLSDILGWALKDMENLNRGGFLESSDFGLEELSSNLNDLMMEDILNSSIYGECSSKLSI